MFQRVLAHLTNRRSDEPREALTLPWQGVALFVCLLIVPILAAVVYQAVFGAPLPQF
jgi:hypothetical protein